MFFRLHDFRYIMLVYILSYLGQSSHYPLCFGAGVTNLSEPLSSFSLPPHYCRLEAVCMPFRAIVNKKQCETRGLFMSLVIRYCAGCIHLWNDMSGGALNSTDSLSGPMGPLSCSFGWGLRNREINAALSAKWFFFLFTFYLGWNK